MDAIRPYELYGESRATKEPMPATHATINSTRMVYLNHEIAGEYVYGLRFLRFRKAAIISWSTPNGQIIEQ